jgi:uncharacterized protein YjbI with pentapeptide repeats
MVVRKAGRTAWGLAAILSVLVMGGIALLGVRLRPYWVAKYRGQDAWPPGAFLTMAPLCGADLVGTNRIGADLTGAYLEGAKLSGPLLATKLVRAHLEGANLKGASWAGYATDSAGARYGARTRGPADLRPRERQAVRVPCVRLLTGRQFVRGGRAISP